MIQHKNIPLTLNKKPIRGDIDEYSRNGTKSPILYIIIYDNHRYTPYAAKRVGIELTLTSLFYIVYSNVNLIPTDSSISELFVKISKFE